MAPSASTTNAHAEVARDDQDRDDDLSSDTSSLLDQDVLQDPDRVADGSARPQMREQAWANAATSTQPSGFFERLGFGQRRSFPSAAYTTLSGDEAAQDAPTSPTPRIPLTRTGQFFYILREMFFSSRLNILVFFFPLGAVLYFIKANPAVVFIVNAIAIVPLSALLTDATERIANDSGDTIGALLNISLGNLVELILFVALVNNHIRIVQASILGSILVNLLLILGSALLACSMADLEAVYSTQGTQLLGCLLFVSVFAFLMPTAFDYTFKHLKHSKGAILKMSRISSFIVLAIYVLYFVHELKTRQKPDEEAATVPVNAPRDISRPASAHERSTSSHSNRHIRFAEDSHPNSKPHEAIEMQERGGSASKSGAIQNDGEHHSRRSYDAGTGGGSSYSRRGSDPRARSGSGSMRWGHGRANSRESFTDSDGRRTYNRTTEDLGPEGRRVLRRSALPTRHILEAELLEPKHHAGVTRFVSILVLIVTSALMSLSAEFLVSTIDEVTHRGQLSESVIGLIILPIVGNMAEYITVVTVAVKEKLDLAIAVSVGSSIQIALCVTPLTVLAAWILDRDLVLTFSFFEMATLVGTVLLVNLIILSEGAAGPRSSALKGGLICGCYAIIGIGAYLSPELE
ncbi:sodium/calcium exchanger protein [Sarocladium implicatum]|nr:sodium/calcium exchanger protein [Sarocladium implicatum]